MSVSRSLRQKVRDEYHRVLSLRRIMDLQRVSIALARGAATSPLRSPDPACPETWEFGAFSQNREDGVIDYLCRRINSPNRYFVEIGAADGLENNTAWLAIALRYSGVMVEGDPASAAQCKALLQQFTLGVKTLNLFVEPEDGREIYAASMYENPDFFSIDIDGNDYYVLKSIFEAGLRPKVVAVEYNSAYGPHRSMTIRYRPEFDYQSFHDSGLYYGVSIAGWRAFFDRLGYRFVTVDSNGVNAFFIDPGAFDAEFVDNLRGLAFRENFYQKASHRASWEAQFELIKDQEFREIS